MKNPRARTTRQRGATLGAAVAVVAPVLALALLAAAPGPARGSRSGAAPSGAPRLRPAGVGVRARRATGTTATATAVATPGGTQRAGATPTGIARTAVPSLSTVYYQDGQAVDVVSPFGGRQVQVAMLPLHSTIPPRLLSDGRLLYPTTSGFETVDPFGNRAAVATPVLGAGESIWSVVPAPDASRLAWVLVTPRQLTSRAANSYTVNTGSVRVAVSDRFGNGAVAVLHAQSGAYGAAPVVLGWRPASQDGAGGPTLLLQDLYSGTSTADGIATGALRGLIEYDPTIRDIVNDYLPPLDSDVPVERAFSVSPDGAWAVYGSANVFTPSGEGPLAHRISALDLDTNTLVALDSAANYPVHGTVTISVTRRIQGRSVLTHGPVELHLYHYFSHHAFVSPDDSHVLYTQLDVSYPPGARLPHVGRRVLIATLGAQGTQHSVLAENAQAEGWLNSTLAVVKHPDGLYSVDIGSGATRLLAASTSPRLHLIGVR